MDRYQKGKKPFKSEESKCCKLLIKIQKLCNRIETEHCRREMSIGDLARKKRQTTSMLKNITEQNAEKHKELEIKEARGLMNHKRMLQSIQQTNDAALATLSKSCEPLLMKLRQEVSQLEAEKSIWMNNQAKQEPTTIELEPVVKISKPNTRELQLTSESKVTDSEVQEVKVEVGTISAFASGTENSIDVPAIQKIQLPPRRVYSQSERFAQQLEDAEKRLMSRKAIKDTKPSGQADSTVIITDSTSKAHSFLTAQRKDINNAQKRSNNDLFIEIYGESAQNTSIGSRVAAPPKKDLRLPVPQCLSPSSMDNAATSRFDPEMEKNVKQALAGVTAMPKQQSDQLRRNSKIAGPFATEHLESVQNKRRASQPHEVINCIQNLMVKFQELNPKV
jgi:hypothetical protein